VFLLIGCVDPVVDAFDLYARAVLIAEDGRIDRDVESLSGELVVDVVVDGVDTVVGVDLVVVVVVYQVLQLLLFVLVLHLQEVGTRDVLHSEDVVSCVVRLLERDEAVVGGGWVADVVVVFRSDDR
jgi:hypothetical protein